MALNKLKILVEDLNGEHAYSSLRAQFGYVQPHERLQVIQSVIDKCQDGTDEQKEIKMTYYEMICTIYVNYAKLTKGKVPDAKAIRIAVLRARWILDGNLLRSNNGRATPIDEVDIVPEPEDFDVINKKGEMKLDASGNMLSEKKYIRFAEMFNSLDIESWQGIAPVIWQVVAHVFRVRGHHYKEEYIGLYERTWKGTTLELPDNLLTWADLSRTAIHSFGVKALERGTAHYFTKDVFTASLELRRDAIPCGAAIVGTAYAALMQLKSTPWYNDFYKQYSVQVEDLVAEYENVKKYGLAYHVAAGLYGLQKRSLDKEAATALAPILVGYIRATPKGTAIKSQRALDLSADNNPMMMEIMRAWLTNQVDVAAEKLTLKKALGLDDGSG